jgi:hypothetical protein
MASLGSKHVYAAAVSGSSIGLGLLLALGPGCASDDAGDDAAANTSNIAKKGDKSKTRTRPEDLLDQTETPLPDGVPSRTPNFVNRGRAGVVETVVDATSETEWRYFDLDTGEQTDDKKLWDLGFSRSRVRINGGISGPGSVKVATLSQPFDDVHEAPADDAYRGEDPDSEGENGDADTEPDNAFYSSGDDWFAYNVMTHELTPREVTFVVESTKARHYKLRFIDYYDQKTGTPARITLRWIGLEPAP